MIKEGIKKASDKYNGIYRGLVVDNEDPLQMGRVKVEVHPMFNELVPVGGTLADTLPWAVPAQPIFQGAGAGFGAFAIPKEDTEVWCFFENGDFMQPVYFAEALTAVHGLPTERTAEYPNAVVWKTKEGHVYYCDPLQLYIKHHLGHKLTMNLTIAKLEHELGHYLLMNATDVKLFNLSGHYLFMDNTDVKLFHIAGHYLKMTAAQVDLYCQRAPGIFNYIKVTPNEIELKHFTGAYIKIDVTGNIEIVPAGGCIASINTLGTINVAANIINLTATTLVNINQ